MNTDAPRQPHPADNQNGPDAVPEKPAQPQAQALEPIGDRDPDLKQQQLQVPEADSGLLTPELAQTWLAWQCRMISGLMRGALYISDSQGHLGAAITSWPVAGAETKQLDKIAAQALLKNTDMAKSRVLYGPDQQRVCDLIACPISLDKKPFCVVACSISTRSEPQQRAILQLLRWGGLWLESLVLQQAKTLQESGSFTQKLLIDLFSHNTSHAAAIEIVNGLEKHLHCERVSLGFQESTQIRLRAISQLASFDHRSELIRQIEAAMEEAVDQGGTIVWPAPATIRKVAEPDKATLISRAHDELSRRQGTRIQLCTVPLAGKSGYIGAITLERTDDKPFSRDAVQDCEMLARILGPTLELKQKDERTLWAKGAESLQRSAANVVGPRYIKFKLGLVVAVIVIALLALFDGNYTVTAPANIEAASRQVLVAPQDGYIKKVNLRAGDPISKGQLIATLDDRSLQLELQKWQSEQRKIDNEYQQALAIRDRAQITILQAQRDQARAEQLLVEDQLARTRLVAPFDGIIVSGDLSQSLGAPVAIGQVLYEVAPINSYRVALELNEYDMAGLTAGKTGRLMIAALPQKPFEIVLQQVIPVAISDEGRNYFRIEATLTEPATALQAGMRGVAKVDMGKRNMLWIWTHAVVDRVKLWFWSVGL